MGRFLVFAAAMLAAFSSAVAGVSVSECELPSSRLAAKELTAYFEKMTGTAEVGFETKVGTLSAFPGEVPGAAKTALAKTSNREAAWTSFDGTTLWIVGKDETAELYATYRFLERELGVRWFQAPVKEDPGEYVPHAERIVLKPFVRCEEPFSSVRRLDQTGAPAWPLPKKGMTCAIRNGFQVAPSYGGRVPYGRDDAQNAWFIPRVPHWRQQIGGDHLTFVKPLGGGDRFAEHPEYFALVNGERTKGGKHMNQYCLSNPEVIRLTADWLIAELEKTGGVGQFNFGQVDTPHGSCQCAGSLAMDGENERKSTASRPSHTTRFVKAVNQVCARVFERFPRADLSIWAYSSYRELPEDVRPDPRLKLYFCSHQRCYGHALDDPNCPRNVRIYGLMKAWLAMLPRAFTYEYMTCTPNLYTPSENVEAHDLRLYRKLGLMGWKNETLYPDAVQGKRKDESAKDRMPSNWQWLYVTGHLLWDPSLDENALLADAESKYYGTAYPVMAKYQALRRKLWNASSEHMGYSTGDQRRPQLLNVSGAKEELLAYLDAADRLIEESNDEGEGERRKDVLRYRVGRDRAWLEKYWVRPNDEIKAVAGRTLRVPRTKTAPVIDGDAGDTVWAKACYIDAFCKHGTQKNPVAVEPELATSVGILFDDENLYFLLRAKEPLASSLKPSTRPGADVWDEDGFEVFLFPPSVENLTYHLSVNPVGNTWGATAPRGTKSRDAFGAEAKGRIGADGYVVELRVPLKNIAPAREEEPWKMHFGRNRRVVKGAPFRESIFAVDGVDYSDLQYYRPVAFGRAYLKNGSFEELDKNGKPKDWSVSVGAVVEPSATGCNQLRLGNGQQAWQTMWHGALRQADVPRRMSYCFKAKGRGRAVVSFLRYRDVYDANTKGHSRRESLKPDGEGDTFDLTSEMQSFTGEYEIPAGEWNSIVIGVRGGAMILDDVAVIPVP